ncbi:MAG TPA: DUF6298 domain-containing protein [Chryseolinea sp.]|nr:DUF6298 domain-containing protein [Chryseolinea sp.]
MTSTMIGYNKLLLIYTFLILTASDSVAQHFNGPLKRNAANPRYFTDNSGKAIYLTGSHTWENLQDMVSASEINFDYEGYLEMMERNGHNFMRMWSWEQSQMAPWSSEVIYIRPLPFARTGPGLAKDNKPKFDLKKYNPEYFQRLRQRVEQAAEKGIYVSVMLFQGWSQDRIDSKVGNPFPYLPYNALNNINKISAPETPEDYDDKPSLHSMLISPKLLAFQKAYVKKVVETLNDLDNVLYEIINEGGATEWQYHMITFIKSIEKQMTKQHPVGMTHRGDKIMTNKVLFQSPADWISPNYVPYPWTLNDSTIISSFKEDPPQADGTKIVINDTDHLWGHGGNHKWVWKSFLRGLNPIFIDPWDPLPGKKNDDKAEGWLVNRDGISKDDRNYPDWDLIRANMGHTLKFAKDLDLNNMKPHSELASTTYCLSHPGNEYLIYFPEGKEASINLKHSTVKYKVLWFIPLLNKNIEGPKHVLGGNIVVLEPPTSLDAILYLKKL